MSPGTVKGKFATLMGFAHPRAEPVRQTGSQPKLSPGYQGEHAQIGRLCAEFR